MKAIRTLFFLLTICQSTVLKAQFSSSQEVYCYQYKYTTNDGIISKRDIANIFFFFQKDMMGIAGGYDAKTVGRKIIEDPNLFREEAIKDWRDRYNKWTSTPSHNNYLSSVRIYKFNKNYSTSSNYSYMEYSKEVKYQRLFDGYLGRDVYSWLKPEWKDEIYTFSVDKSELIIWDKTKPDDRDIYKRINPNSLKPNLDFLN